MLTLHPAQFGFGVVTMSMSIYLSTLTGWTGHGDDSPQGFTDTETMPDPYLMVSAVFCSATVFIFSALELFLAFFSSREHHW